VAPIFDSKDYDAPSVFAATALLREARRQKGLRDAEVPHACILDPDGDIVRRLRDTGRAKRFDDWPCYHTQLDVFELASRNVGIVGCAVGAPFAVLVAEELFASGCRLLISVTSAGQITRTQQPPYFVIIDRALRDEGTSDHYAPAAEFADADAGLIRLACDALANSKIPVLTGTSWTTDAPFRETATAIEWARSKGALAVEMEAAALYTLARIAKVRILCLAHVTNTMGQAGQDFEKGEFAGTHAALSVLEAIISHAGP